MDLKMMYIAHGWFKAAKTSYFKTDSFVALKQFAELKSS
jgi:hypothetical protein